MTNRRTVLRTAALLAALAAGKGACAQPAIGPLAIGDTFTLRSAVLGEQRRINVYNPPKGVDAKPLPVLYMPDGGMNEDFLHIAGLLQVSIANGSMRPFMLVGIENTQRRRDMTGPSDDPRDRAIAPVIGGAAAFRQFIREELMPAVKARYRTTNETAIIGESLAGLFVMETLFQTPELFDTYIAIDPSVWWNNEYLLKAGAPPGTRQFGGKTLYVGVSNEPGMPALSGRLRQVLETAGKSGLSFSLTPFPEESHGTIYHPAALRAVRTVFKPQ